MWGLGVAAKEAMIREEVDVGIAFGVFQIHYGKSLPRYIHTLRRISANSLQDRVDEYCFLVPSVCQQEELSSAGTSEDREDTESAPLQSEGDIDEVEVDQPNPSKEIFEWVVGSTASVLSVTSANSTSLRRRTRRTIQMEGAIGEVLEGKRIKKTVERLNFQRHIPERFRVKVENGRGVKLGDIPRIDHHISKMHASDLKPLYILLFGTPGRKTSRKNHLRQFNGFTFEVDSELYIRRRQKMLRSFTSKKLIVICKVLKLMASTEKPRMVDRILSFLNCPRTVLETPSKKNAVKKATPDNSSKSKKATESTGFFLTYTNGSHTLTEESSDDDVPLIKFKKKCLSNEQLIETVQKVLKQANLEEITMKQICQKVYDTYPDLDLTPRKDYIKETVKMIASALLLVSAGNTQESVPNNMQEFVPVNTQQSVPNNTQESVPINTQESVPNNMQESVPNNMQESVPVNTQESAWRTHVENTPKSVPVIMNTDGWFEVERDT